MEKFNDYFSSVFTIDKHPNTLQTSKVDLSSRLTDLAFTEEDIRKKLLKIREDKAPGADDILPRLLCNIIDEICHPLCIIFRKSMDEGIVPDDWRKANVSPLFKQGSRSQASNYRPVSLTSQIC